MSHTSHRHNANHKNPHTQEKREQRREKRALKQVELSKRGAKKRAKNNEWPKEEAQTQAPQSGTPPLPTAHIPTEAHAKQSQHGHHHGPRHGGHKDQAAAPRTEQEEKAKMSKSWTRQEKIWNSSAPEDVRRVNFMRNAVREMLARRWQDGLDVVAETKPEFPGLYLATVKMAPLDRTKKTYREMTDAYVDMKFLMDRAMHENVETRALALLAWGPGVGGEGQLEEGTVPKDWNKADSSSVVALIQNRHHEFQKSAVPVDGRPLNDPTNLLYILTEKDPRQNPHHALHGAILHPQTDFAPGFEPTEPIDVAIVKSTVPFYPPLRLDPRTQKRVSYSSAAEVMRDLERLEPGITQKLPATFQTTWAERLVTISKIARQPIPGHPNHKAFEVLPEFLQATQGYTDIYSDDNYTKDSHGNRGAVIPEKQEAQRRKVSQEAEELAKSLLPAGVHVNGKTLPPDHQPSHPLPVRDGTWKTIPEFEAQREALREPEKIKTVPVPKVHIPPATTQFISLPGENFYGARRAAAEFSSNSYLGQDQAR